VAAIAAAAVGRLVPGSTGVDRDPRSRDTGARSHVDT